LGASKLWPRLPSYANRLYEYPNWPRLAPQPLHLLNAEALFTKPIDFGMLRSEIDTRVSKAA
jgi:hypothetical protein